MFVIFAGTTDHKDEFKERLKAIPHTLLEGSGAWEHGVLPDAQVVITFTREQARQISQILLDLGQKEIPIYQLAMPPTECN